MLEKIRQMTQLLTRDQKGMSATWRQVGRHIEAFLVKIQVLSSIIHLIKNNMTLEMHFPLMMQEIDKSPQHFANAVRQFLLAAQSQKYKFPPQQPVSASNDQPRPPSNSIQGKDIQVVIHYDPNRLEINYSFKTKNRQNLDLSNHLKDYVRKLIQKEKFSVISPMESLFILDGKKHQSNQYTDAYLFDPFFGSVTFEMRKKRQTFNGNFKVVNSKDIEIILKPQNDRQYWTNHKQFTSETKIQELVEYIVKKQRGDPSITQYYLNQLKIQNNLQTVGDLFKIDDPKRLNNIIRKQKWACQLALELKRCKTKGVKSSFKSAKEQKLQCLKLAYSHKILRFLFFRIKDDNLSDLNKTIPYLNPQIVNLAIDILRRTLFIQGLFDQLMHSLRAFSYIPEQGQQYKTPHGLLFYGPPGTGKTQLTEKLAQLMGFHLVSNGLSSSNFMKELVGGAKGTVQGYFNRALLSPHLICSLAIDQIDPLVQRRENGGGNKGSQQTISKFLSMMGGNQCVPNLLVMGSTNLFNKIDDAMIRRFSQSFYVGLPNKSERALILNFYNSSLAEQGISADFLTNITPNFSGAGLEEISKRIKYAQMHSWNTKDLMQVVSKNAQNLKLYFGTRTYPQLLTKLERNQQIQLEFMDHVQKKTIFFLKQEQHKHYMGYFFDQQKFIQGKVQSNYVFCKNQIYGCRTASEQYITQWLKKGGSNFQIVKPKSLLMLQAKQFQEQKQNIKTVVLLEIKVKEWESIPTWLLQPIKNPNMFFCLYTNDTKLSNTIYNYCSEAKKKYSGRVLIDLSQQYPIRMQFELKAKREDFKKIQIRPILASNYQIINQEELYPQIVDYFIKQNLSFIQVIDSSFFGASNIFDDNQCLSLINSKVQQLNKYKKGAIIIDFDSIIKLSNSVSNGSSGPSNSYSIDRSSLYRELLNIAQKQAIFEEDQQRWICLLVKNKELVKLVRRAVNWPFSIAEQQEQYQQNEKKRQQEEDKKIKQCVHCHQFFTEEDNKKKRQCNSHYGEFIDIKTGHAKNQMSLEQARCYTQRHNHGRQTPQVCFIYSCCWKKIDSTDCNHPFKHYSKGSHEADQWLNQKISTHQIREGNRQRFRQTILDNHNR